MQQKARSASTAASSHGDLGVVGGLGKPPPGGELGLQIPSRSLLHLPSRSLRRHVGYKRSGRRVFGAGTGGRRLG
eukprot:scaffold46757_cov69-Phaeocystis_antarctica.AAC.5